MGCLGDQAELPTLRNLGIAKGRESPENRGVAPQRGRGFPILTTLVSFHAYLSTWRWLWTQSLAPLITGSCLPLIWWELCWELPLGNFCIKGGASPTDPVWPFC